MSASVLLRLASLFAEPALLVGHVPRGQDQVADLKVGTTAASHEKCAWAPKMIRRECLWMDYARELAGVRADVVERERLEPFVQSECDGLFERALSSQPSAFQRLIIQSAAARPPAAQWM